MPIFREIVILRDEAARLMGYANHAAFQIEEKMGKTPEAVISFLSGLLAEVAASGDRNQKLEELRMLKKEEIQGRGEQWDENEKLWL